MRPRKQAPIGEKDLSTIRVRGTMHPRTHTRTPPVTRVVRIIAPYSGTAYVYNLTSNDLSNQDQTDYNTSGARYSALHITRLEVWFSCDTLPTAGVLPLVSVTDAFSNVTFEDTPNLGVDWSHVAMRPCLYARQTQRPYNDTTPLASIDVPAAAGARGTIIMDCTVVFA